MRPDSRQPITGLFAACCSALFLFGGMERGVNAQSQGGRLFLNPEAESTHFLPASALPANAPVAGKAETSASGGTNVPEPGSGESGGNGGAPSDPLGALSPDIATNNAYILSLNEAETQEARLREFETKLELAKRFRQESKLSLAATNLLQILEADPPESIKRESLLELALTFQGDGQLVKAQQLFSRYLYLYPEDPKVPETLLRQGLLYREMGAHTLALSKFYSVMTSALTLKLEQFDYYQRLVLHAQTEIAHTYYFQGKYPEAVDYFRRLLRLETPHLNKSQIQYQLVRCLSYMGDHAEVATQAEDFLGKHAGSEAEPELRFILATSLKKLGRNRDALGQVLRLLETQRAGAASNPQDWLYWQQRTGNAIANQLYQEGDYANALEVYLSLLNLEDTVQWQFPVLYQIGLVYEKLEQPEKAAETFEQILQRKDELNGTPSPSLEVLIEMAGWRRDFISWQKETHLAREAVEPVFSPASIQKSKP